MVWEMVAWTLREWVPRDSAHGISTTSVELAGDASGKNCVITPAGDPVTDQRGACEGGLPDKLTKKVADAPAGSVCAVGVIVTWKGAAAVGEAGLAVRDGAAVAATVAVCVIVGWVVAVAVF